MCKVRWMALVPALFTSRFQTCGSTIFIPTRICSCMRPSPATITKYPCSRKTLHCPTSAAPCGTALRRRLGLVLRVARDGAWALQRSLSVFWNAQRQDAPRHTPRGGCRDARQKGWTREQAIQYSLDHEAESEASIVSEIERYMSWPGQALSYKVGQLKIRALRAKAEQALGAKFDIRTFHKIALENGCLPLTVLEGKIDRWVAEGK